MTRTFQRSIRSIAIGLAVCLLLLSGTVYAQTVAHAVHHAHHQAATHGTVLCSWMCAAGQVLEGGAVCFQADAGPLTLAGVPVSQAPPTILLDTPATRGPPFSV